MFGRSLLTSFGVVGTLGSLFLGVGGPLASAAKRSATEPLTFDLCASHYDLGIISPVMFIRFAIAFYIALFVLSSSLYPAPARPSRMATRRCRWETGTV